MSAALDRLRALGYYSPYRIAEAAGMAGMPDVYVEYRPQETGRWFRCAAWQVVRPGYKTDPKGHWGDGGHKTFNVFRVREEKEDRLDDAIEWAASRYGVRDWARIPGMPRTYFPTEVATWVKQQLAQAKKEAAS